MISFCFSNNTVQLLYEFSNQLRPVRLRSLRRWYRARDWKKIYSQKQMRSSIIIKTINKVVNLEFDNLVELSSWTRMQCKNTLVLASEGPNSFILN